MAVNVCYMVVVPKENQISDNVAQQFFQRTFGVLGDDDTGERVLNAFLAISSLGNIIVMTYTASRMKQEIAKQGFLPFAQFFATDRDFSLGRLLRWFQGRNYFTSLLQHKWFSPETHTEKTPVGALFLHFVSCMILIAATSRLHPDDSYVILSSSSAYLFPAFFGLLLALGILILRFGTPPATAPVSTPLHPSVPGSHHHQYAAKRTWAQMTEGTVNPTLSVRSNVAWFVVPTISCSVLALSSFWFLGFLARAKRRERKRHQEFVIERSPEFEFAEGDDGFHGGEDGNDAGRRAGGLILTHETVSHVWRGKDTMELERMADAPVAEVQKPPAFVNNNPYAGTDFEGMGR
ncbi:unnamed protein product [Parascedosporium putredinis]|uniref:Uncharacterized protein n=1 Tax=Parascedosporium putredinis TaxID=1442378 RepID=A0A9P1GZU4_9PEZI|nr:unnamed protein product [Parascedosporium putredinis]CAI7992169.1 unnamed protein product [Parascedosporium putredinis]